VATIWYSAPAASNVRSITPRDFAAPPLLAMGLKMMK
jgi:hypothetical protein